MDLGNGKIVQANISTLQGSNMDPAEDIDEQLAQVSLTCIQSDIKPL